MRVKVITPPGPIVSLDEVKLHCKIDSDDENVLVQSYIDAAVRWIDGPGGWLGRALGKQTLELSGWFGCRVISLPYPPIIGNVSVLTEDEDGLEEAADPSSFRYSDGELTVKSGAGWVSRPKHRIRYDAGYEVLSGDPPTSQNNVPPPIKVAIFMIVNHWYENREAVSGPLSQVPLSADTMLSTYRVW